MNFTEFKRSIHLEKSVTLSRFLEKSITLSQFLEKSITMKLGFYGKGGMTEKFLILGREKLSISRSPKQ